MKRRLIILWVLASCVSIPVSIHAQEYPASAIADSLKKNANAVVRNYNSLFVQTDINNGTHKVTKVVTVLKEEGKKHGNEVVYRDKFRDLKSFSGKIVDGSGKVIKKINQKDLNNSAYSNDLATDAKYAYYDYKPTGYPYTVHYEYEIKYKNGIPHYPVFFPVMDYNLSVEQANYQIQVPKGMKIRYKAERLTNDMPKESSVGDQTIYEWSATELNAIESEVYSPDFLTIVPVVHVAPNDFCMEGYCGNMSDWDNLGKWIEKLITGRDVISQQMKEKMVALTADAADDKEKVERVYKFLQSTTRYISIQLGIGGYQPIIASVVEKNGFGDCKGLSNYLKSLLAAIGIPSVYTVISTDHAELYADFSSPGQMNHVILAVPLASDTLWLECTNQVLPFNYIHTGIAGHQCLWIAPEGGKICRVRKASEIGDDKTRRITIEVNEEGNGMAHIVAAYRLNAYEGMIGFLHQMSLDEQINLLTRNLKADKAKISNLKIVARETEDPEVNLDYDAYLERFTNKTGNRLFVPFTLLNIPFASINPSKRKQDILIRGGIQRSDTLIINLPTEYKAETLPKSTAISNRFGAYSLDIQLKDNTLQLIQFILIREGRYPANAISEFKDFFTSMEAEWNKRAVFTKTL